MGRSSLSTILSGLLIGLIGCRSAPQYSEQMHKELALARAELEDSIEDSHYIRLAEELANYPILHFGETHPSDTVDVGMQPLERCIPLFERLTDRRIMGDKVYNTLILENVPTAFDNNRRVIPQSELDSLSRGVFNSKDAPTIYSYMNSRVQIGDPEIASLFFGPSHNRRGFGQLVRVLAGRDLKICGSLPTYERLKDVFTSALDESRVRGYSRKKAKQHVLDSLGNLVGTTTLDTLVRSIDDSLARSELPRIILYGGKAHNDEDLPVYGREFPFIGLGDNLNVFRTFPVLSIDIVNPISDGRDPYDLKLQGMVTGAKPSSRFPYIVSSTDSRIADCLYVCPPLNKEYSKDSFVK